MIVGRNNWQCRMCLGVTLSPLHSVQYPFKDLITAFGLPFIPIQICRQITNLLGTKGLQSNLIDKVRAAATQNTSQWPTWEQWWGNSHWKQKCKFISSGVRKVYFYLFNINSEWRLSGCKRARVTSKLLFSVWIIWSIGHFHEKALTMCPCAKSKQNVVSISSPAAVSSRQRKIFDE